MLTVDEAVAADEPLLVWPPLTGGPNASAAWDGLALVAVPIDEEELDSEVRVSELDSSDCAPWDGRIRLSGLPPALPVIVDVPPG